MNQETPTSTPDKICDLLDQFGQVILSGPPGTGKTMLARDVAASLLLESVEMLENNSRFDFVQFHPAYNYEDFVRGIRMEVEEGGIVYKTKDRIFGNLAKRAAQNPYDKHVLVIDEINRANVSGVLGDLIYALEYRDKLVQTPYSVAYVENGESIETADLVVPKNLYVIGTMNTADRTIGQIDYAVRRRFAFIHCAPDAAMVNRRVSDLFNRVKQLFEPKYLSPDCDAKDVAVGHTYFMARGDKPESELANKIIYQVVPLLEEYLKDGVLMQGTGAEDVIGDILHKAKQMNAPSGRQRGEWVSVRGIPRDAKLAKKVQWKWARRGTGAESEMLPLGQMILSLVQDYAARKKCETVQELQEAFPKGTVSPVSGVQSDRRFFLDYNERIHLLTGESAAVAKGWSANRASFFNFRYHARMHGYKITPYVNRAWGRGWVLNVRSLSRQR